MGASEQLRPAVPEASRGHHCYEHRPPRGQKNVPDRLRNCVPKGRDTASCFILHGPQRCCYRASPGARPQYDEWLHSQHIASEENP